MAKRKGISPVIATVIIVAVTIAVAIAVAFWMTGLIGLFTGTERLEIVSIDVTPQNNGWEIIVRVKNTGTVAVTIEGLYINGRLVATSDGQNWQKQTDACTAMQNNPTGKARLSPGDSTDIKFTLSSGQNQNSCAGATLTPGISIEIKLRSSGGKEYPKLVVLP